MPELTLEAVNAMDESTFEEVFGSVFEHSPWIARRTWPRRPFGDRADLHRKMCRVLRGSTLEEQLDVIIAHPDLGERLAPLTAESIREQASAGLNQLTATELGIFRTSNTAYKEKFGFPFVICARLSDKDQMLAAFKSRLQNNRDEEMTTAIGQIELIAQLRLQSLIP